MRLILTYDYELFGDGSGDVFQHMIAPTDKILEVCRKHNIQTTLFFEVVEYWYLKKEWESGNKMGYKKDPINAIEEQLKAAYQEGHDIQLHFHPQWLGARYENGKWLLNHENWRLGDFQPKDGMDTEKLFVKAIDTLKQILKPIDPNYAPQIIRAGGYNILPSTAVAQAMISTGLVYDSSVYPGGYENGSLSRYDYRETSLDLDYWSPQIENFSFQSDRDMPLKEIPIFSLKIPRWRKFTKERIKSILLNKESAMKSVSAKTSQKNLLEKINYWFEKEAITWDFCLFSKKLNKKYFKYIQKNLLGKRDTFVLIGHPKNFTSQKSLDQLIELAKNNHFEFTSLINYARRIDA